MDDDPLFYPVLLNEETLPITLICRGGDCAAANDGDNSDHPVVFDCSVEYGRVRLPVEPTSPCGYEFSDEVVHLAVEEAVDSFFQAGVGGGGGSSPQTVSQVEILNKLLADDSGSDSEEALFKLIPELQWMQGFEQNNPYHPEGDLWTHTVSVVERVAALSDDKDLQWVALLHDIGKLPGHWDDADGRRRYYRNKELGIMDHEAYSAGMANDILRRIEQANPIEMPTARRERIVHLVRNHGFEHFRKKKTAQKFIETVGKENVDTLLLFQQADNEGDPAEIKEKLDILRGILASQMNPTVSEKPAKPTLALTPQDIIAIHGQPGGPWLGQTIGWLTKEVMEGNVPNTPEALTQHLQTATIS